MRIDAIKEKLEKIIEPFKIEINSIKTKREYGEKILEILLKGPNLNTDILETVHRTLFDNLVDGDLDDDYFLELSSLGAEYPLNSLDEVKAHIGSYVYLETNQFKSIGYLLEVNDEEITIEYNAKGQFRKLKIKYDTINNIRTSVKI